MPDFLSKKITRKSKQKKLRRRILSLLALFVLICLTGSAGLYVIFLRPAPAPVSPLPLLENQAKKPRTAPTPRPARPQTPAYEEPAVPHTAPPKKTASPPAAAKPKSHKPLVALIIDDMGYRQKSGDQLLALKLPLSYAFLPFAPFTESQLAQARKRRSDILLHLPLEATDPKWDPGPGTLTTRMDAYTMKIKLHENLRAVPYAIGINNHMGSRFTADADAMKKLLLAIRDLDIFFLDSITSSQSKGFSLAKEMGIKTGRRNVFIDNDQDPDKILAQLNGLVKYATAHGEAIGIGHPYPATVQALRRFQDKLPTDIELVGIRRLIKRY